MTPRALSLLLLSKLFDLLVDSPFVTKGIDQFSVTSAPEHVCYGNHDSCPSFNCLLNRSIGVINFEHDSNASASECARAPAGSALTRTELITNKEAVPPNLDLSIQKLFAILAHHPRAFQSPERSLVKFESCRTVVNEDLWGNAVRFRHKGRFFLPAETRVNPSGAS